MSVLLIVIVILIALIILAALKFVLALLPITLITFGILWFIFKDKQGPTTIGKHQKPRNVSVEDIDDKRE